MKKLPICCFLFCTTVLFAQDNSLEKQEYHNKLEKNIVYKSYEQNKSKLSKQEIIDYEIFLRTIDIDAGRPTPEKLQPIFEQLRNNKRKTARLGDVGQAWVERGPNNVGGRTRAMIFDLNTANNNSNYKRVFAGGIDGGVWVNQDITNAASAWTQLWQITLNCSVNCLAQDPSNPLIMYAGTGEPWNNIDAKQGQGLYKTTNGGSSWILLPGATTIGFQFITDIVVLSTGRIIAGFFSGTINSGYSNALAYSDNGGLGWSVVQPFFGNGGPDEFVADLELATNGTLYASTGKTGYTANGKKGKIFKSTNSGINWTEITPKDANGNIIGNPERVEIAVAPNNSNVIYAIASKNSGNTISNDVEWFKRSKDGGNSWLDIPIPKKYDSNNCILGTSDFTEKQAWYNLILEVHPTNSDIVYAGGRDLHKLSYNTSSGTWADNALIKNTPTTGYNSLISTSACTLPYMHADQHVIRFRPAASNEMVFGNDGGIYYSANAGNTLPITVSSRNTNYNVTQFWTCAVSYVYGSNNFLAGSQDNGTQMFNSPGLGSTTRIAGGDGAYCFIDNNGAGNNQIAASQYFDYYFSTNSNWSSPYMESIPEESKMFINPTDYDYTNKRLYMGESFVQNNSISYSYGVISNIFDGSIITSDYLGSSIARLGAPITSLKLSFINPVLYIGTSKGDLIKVQNPSTSSATVTNLPYTGGRPIAPISSIMIWGLTDQNIVITYSNFSPTKSNIWLSTDGGQTWQSRDSKPQDQAINPLPANVMPDMPIWWILNNPNDRDECYVATDMGVWVSTDFVTPIGTNPKWNLTTNFPMTKTHMIKFAPRESGSNKEYVVAAATHGRGLWTSKFLSSANREGKQLDDYSYSDTSADAKLFISPNPANDYFQIHTNTEGEILQIFNIAGLLVKEQTTNQGSQRVSTSNLVNGMYVVKLKGKPANYKLIISR